MKSYENLKIEVTMLDSSDVIATSEGVTTSSITMQWQNDNNASPAPFSFMRETGDGNYKF